MTASAEVGDDIRKLHADFVAEIHRREVSSAENFDKSVLTFSSAGLALSIGFLKDFVPIELAAVPWALYASWIFFTAATCATMASFLLSSRALAEQKELAYAYYIERDAGAFERTNHWDRATRFLNYFSGGAFLLAMVLSVLFISLNLQKGSAMKDNTTQHSGGYTDLLKKGLTVPAMQKVPTVPAQSGSGQMAPAPAPTSNPAGK